MVTADCGGCGHAVNLVDGQWVDEDDDDQCYDDDTNRLGTHWPAHPIVCESCATRVAKPCEDEVISGLCLRCLNGGPPDHRPAGA